jgi:hypothetical protein
MIVQTRYEAVTAVPAAGTAVCPMVGGIPVAAREMLQRRPPAIPDQAPAGVERAAQRLVAETVSRGRAGGGLYHASGHADLNRNAQ